MKREIRTLLVSSFSATVLLAGTAPAQLTIPIACEVTADIDTTIYNAVTQSWMENDYLPYLTNHHWRMAPDGKILSSVLRRLTGVAQQQFMNAILNGEPSGAHSTIVFGPSRAYATAALLADWGVGGLGTPPIQQVGGVWQYGGGLSITRNHDTRHDYSTLVQSSSVDGCVDINPLTGAPACGERCPDSGFTFWATACAKQETFGEAEYIRFVNTTADKFHGFYSSNGDQPATIQYWCSLLTDPAYGAAYAAVKIVHENFHGVEVTGHSDCGEGNPRGAGECAYRWNETAPTHPKVYDQISTLTHVDSYQLDLRFACDVVQQASDWLPLAVQQVMAAVAGDLQDEPIYQNIANTTRSEDPDYGGLAPLTCGMDPTVWSTVVGATCPGTALLRCDSHAMCPSGSCGVDGCCAPETVIIIR